MVDWNGGMEWWTGMVEWNGLIGISNRCQLFAVTTQQFVYTSVELDLSWAVAPYIILLSLILMY